ncbi:hypothetical protein ONZ45_g9156 [Pleurotus djamor]|nr:hypothetical protein ONZ45_g16810 [Pleurotus djamor]KAJ8508593.1 hypothetical protein ONZ45_g9156 [Pleurotus djamor]
MTTNSLEQTGTMPFCYPLSFANIQARRLWATSQEPTRRNLPLQNRQKRYAVYGIESVLELSNESVPDAQGWEIIPTILVTPPTPLPLGYSTDDSIPDLDSDSGSSSGDDEASWEAQDSPLSQGSEGTNASIKPCTPAEYIVNCFRAGMSLEAIQSSAADMEGQNHNDLGDFDWVSSLDSESVHTQDSGLESATQPHDAATFRIVDYGGLAEARNEAYHVMSTDGLGERDAIACRRPDCRDVLQDVKALVYHLHIHNLHDE